MNDNYNDFEGGGSYTENGGYGLGGYGLHGEPRWDDFSLDDEKRARGRFSRFFLACFVYLAVSFILVKGAQIVVALLYGGDFAKEFFANPYVNMAAQVIIMYVISLPIFYLIVRGMRSVIRSKSKITVKEFFALFFVGEACMLGGSMVSNLITNYIDFFLGIEVSDTVPELVTSTPLWLIFLVAVVIGPIVEELMFRKLLMDKLGMYGDRLAIVVSAVAFGIFHRDINQIFYATLLGFVLAYLYSRTGNMWMCVLLHSVINFFGSIVPMLIMEPMERFYELYSLLLSEQAIDEAEFASLAPIVFGYAILTYGMVFAGIFIFFKYRKRIFVSDRCEVLIPKKRRASVIILNVGSILFILFCIASMIFGIVVPALAAATEEGGSAIWATL